LAVVLVEEIILDMVQSDFKVHQVVLGVVVAQEM
jgi:hypothetical protein